MRSFICVVAASLFPLAGCSPEAVAPAEEPVRSIDTPFTSDLLKQVAEYQSWGRVDDMLRWAPTLCLMPKPRAYVSASADEESHGRKLYSLFAKNRNEYALLGDSKTVSIGQIVVKQSWLPEEVKDVKEHNPQDHFDPYVRKGDKTFKASTPAGLFVMMKLDPKTDGTDEGWVYATLSSDAKTVTAAGRIESCMKCHQETKTDRLFGLQK